jgi:hypothetical protein
MSPSAPWRQRRPLRAPKSSSSRPPAGGGAALLRKLAAVPALARVAPVRQQLHNQYFDTPAQDLRARRAAPRLRRVQGAGAGSSGCKPSRPLMPSCRP